MTCNPGSLARSPISASVTPSAKYSSLGSPEMLSSGNTRIDETAGLGGGDFSRLKNAYAIPASTNGTSIKSAYRNLGRRAVLRSEEHTSELQSQSNLVCRLLLEKKKKYK